MSKLEQVGQACVPVVALGELCYGAWKSGRIDFNLARIGQFAAAFRVLACDSGTASPYGEIKNRLRELGRPIPKNDIGIAALARQHRLTVATRDEHFRAIDSVAVEGW